MEFFSDALGKAGFVELTSVGNSWTKPGQTLALPSEELENSFLWLLSPTQDSWKQINFVFCVIIGTEL